MNKYSIYCTRKQTKKALELGAQLLSIKCYSQKEIERAKVIIRNKCSSHYTLFDNFQQSGDYWCVVISNPTAEQMIGWLEGQGFRFDVECISMYCIMPHIDNEYICNPICKESREEATLAAIDAALEYLDKKEK